MKFMVFGPIATYVDRFWSGQGVSSLVADGLSM